VTSAPEPLVPVDAVPVDALGAGGVRIAADVSGRLDRTPVLLLAGQSLGPETSAGLRDDLAGTLPVVVVHTRRTGRSGAGEGGNEDEPWTTGTFADDIVAVLDALGVDRAHVHGFSMGGRVAQVLAARHPGRVDRLVLGATGPGGALEVPRSAEVDRVLRRSTRPEGRAALAELFFTPDWVAGHPEVAAGFAPQGPPRGQRLHHGASTGHDGTALLPLVQAPTLVLHGTDDRLTPVANAHLVAGLVPGARVHELPGARHGYCASHRERTTAVVLEHLLG